MLKNFSMCSKNMKMGGFKTAEFGVKYVYLK